MKAACAGSLRLALARSRELNVTSRWLLWGTLMQYLKDIAQALRGPLRAIAYIVATVVLSGCLWLILEADRIPTNPPPAVWSGAWFLLLSAKLAYFVLIGTSTALVTRLLGGVGMFRDAISDVLGEDAWLDRRNDLEDLWRRITRRIFLPGFREDAPDAPQLLAALNDTMTQMVHKPAQRVSYYAKDVKRRITVRWHNETARTVKMTDVLDCRIFPFEPHKGCIYEIYFTGTTGEPITDYSIQLTKLSIDEEEQDITKVKREQEGNWVRLLVELNGKRSYRLSRTLEIIQNIEADPIFVVAAGRVVWGMSAIVFCDTPAIRINFEEVGVTRVFRAVRTDDANGGFERETNGALFPEQGFMFVMAAKPQPRGGQVLAVQASSAASPAATN
jgi:hypothetical protein